MFLTLFSTISNCHLLKIEQYYLEITLYRTMCTNWKEKNFGHNKLQPCPTKELINCKILILFVGIFPIISVLYMAIKLLPPFVYDGILLSKLTLLTLSCEMAICLWLANNLKNCMCPLCGLAAGIGNQLFAYILLWQLIMWSFDWNDRMRGDLWMHIANLLFTSMAIYQFIILVNWSSISINWSYMGYSY